MIVYFEMEIQRFNVIIFGRNFHHKTYKQFPNNTYSLLVFYKLIPFSVYCLQPMCRGITGNWLKSTSRILCHIQVNYAHVMQKSNRLYIHKYLISDFLNELYFSAICFVSTFSNPDNHSMSLASLTPYLLIRFYFNSSSFIFETQSFLTGSK